jgi:hypothetical protein
MAASEWSYDSLMDTSRTLRCALIEFFFAKTAMMLILTQLNYVRDCYVKDCFRAAFRLLHQEILRKKYLKD